MIIALSNSGDTICNFLEIRYSLRHDSNMARLPRIVVPGCPHHVTQRGNRGQKTFFSSGDYRQYIRLMSQWCHEHGVQIWSYCLMPNHIHLIAVPDRSKLGSAPGIRTAGSRQRQHQNARQNRPSTGKRGLSGFRGKDDRPKSQAAKARTETKKLGIVSPAISRNPRFQE